MRLATTFEDFYPYTKTPAQAVRAMEGTGFRYLDYTFWYLLYPGSPLLSDNWMDQADEAAEAAAELGFTFVQAHAPDYNPLDPGADHEAGMLATLRSIEACGRLGIPGIVVHAGSFGDRIADRGMEEFFREARAFYEKLFPAMEKWNVTVLMENTSAGRIDGKYRILTGQEMADFLDWVGQPLLKACWDTGRANLWGADQYREILKLGGHLKALHIQDNFGGGFDEHIAPLMGTVDLDAVMQALLEIRFPGPFTLEATNTLLAKGGSPHARTETAGIARRPLAQPSLELYRKAEGLLYEIGKFILTAYDCFEE